MSRREPLRRSVRVILASALIASVLGACGGRSPEIHRDQIHVFGTVVNVDIVDHETPRQLVAEIDRRFQAMHRNWHAWKPGPLVTVNQAIAAGRPIEVDPALSNLIGDAQTLSERSEGLFNPAIGGLVALWGFHTDDYPVQGPAPDQAAISRWVESAPSLSDLSITDGLLTSSNTAVQLDFGGFAKGVAVDEAIAILRAGGVRHAIVNAGGDLRAIGFRDGDRGSRPWRIGIRHPVGGWDSEHAILAGITIKGDEAVFTSGNYERYREHQTERWPHIIDPRTGMPVRHVASATVIADDGRTADAAATALVVAGPGEWQRIATRLGISLAMIVDASGQVQMTPGMARRVTLENPGVKPTVVH